MSDSAGSSMMVVGVSADLLLDGFVRTETRFVVCELEREEIGSLASDAEPEVSSDGSSPPSSLSPSLDPLPPPGGAAACTLILTVIGALYACPSQAAY